MPLPYVFPLSFKKSFVSQPFLLLNELLTLAVDLHTCLFFAGCTGLLPVFHVDVRTQHHLYSCFSIYKTRVHSAMAGISKQDISACFKIMQLNSIIEDVVFAFRRHVYSEVS